MLYGVRCFAMGAVLHLDQLLSERRQRKRQSRREYTIRPLFRLHASGVVWVIHGGALLIT